VGASPVTVDGTVARIRAQLEEIKGRLGPRSRLNEDGQRLLHETNAILLILNLATDKRVVENPLTMKELTPVVNRTTRLVTEFRHQVKSEIGPPVWPSIREAMLNAQAGPTTHDTLEHCPQCAGCTLCHDSHMVTPAVANAWRARNAPRGKQK